MKGDFGQNPSRWEETTGTFVLLAKEMEGKKRSIRWGWGCGRQSCSSLKKQDEQKINNPFAPIKSTEQLVSPNQIKR